MLDHKNIKDQRTKLHQIVEKGISKITELTVIILIRNRISYNLRETIKSMVQLGHIKRKSNM